jgi:hypothetical protein
LAPQLRGEIDMRWRDWRIFLGGLALCLGAGCSRPHDDLLVVYSGDCEGYLEPCG